MRQKSTETDEHRRVFIRESNMEEDLIVGAEAAARHLGLTPRAVWHMIYTDKLPFVRKGRRLYFRKSELDRAFTSAA